MQYEALVDSRTCAMLDKATRKPLEALAVIPDHLPDLAALVAAMSPDIAAELARMAERRSLLA